LGAARARVIDQYPSHQTAGDAEELIPVLPGPDLGGQAQIGLVDEVGGPEGMAAPLAPQETRGPFAELLAEEGNELLPRRLVPTLPGLQQASETSPGEGAACRSRPPTGS